MGVVAYLLECFGVRRLLNAAELLHLACICACIVARGAVLRTRRQGSGCIWCVLARVSQRAAPSSGRQIREVVDFGVHIRFLVVGRFLACIHSPEMLSFVWIAVTHIHTKTPTHINFHVNNALDLSDSPIRAAGAHGTFVSVRGVCTS